MDLSISTWMCLLKGSALSCLMVLGQTRSLPPGVGAVADGSQNRTLSEAQHIKALTALTGYRDNTVREGLRMLLEQGLAERGGLFGWKLTGRGRSALRLIASSWEVELNQDDPPRPLPASNAPGIPNPSCGNREMGEPAPAAGWIESISMTFPAAVETIAFVQNFCTSRQLKEEEDLDSDLRNPDLLLVPERTPPLPASGEAGWPPVELILEHSQQVLGERLVGPPERYPDPARLLAWIAQAYSMRSHLRHPARLAFRRLEQGAKPRQRYLDDPCAGLPAGFLHSLGFPAAFCQGREAEAAGEVGEARRAYAWEAADEEAPGEADAGNTALGVGDRQPYLDGPPHRGPPAGVGSLTAAGQAAPGEAAGIRETDMRIATDAPNESPPSSGFLDLPAGPGAAFTVRQAWEHARNCLRARLSVGLYNEWLRPAVLLDFDPQAALFTIQHPDASICELMADRLGKRVLPDLLLGICGSRVSVRFVAE